MNEPPQFRHILVIEDPKGRRIVSLEDSNYSLGRDSHNDIVIYDYQVSRIHATLLRELDSKIQGFSYRIIDGNLQGKRSTNGLVINGNSCLSHELKHGDTIRFSPEAKANYCIVATKAGIDLFNPDDLSNMGMARTSLTDTSKKTLIAKPEEKIKVNYQDREELIRLASFPELSPNPIVEIDWEGNLTYVNPAASIKFENIYEQKLNHPILAGLLSEEQNKQGNLFLREVKIGSEVFEQYVHYLSEKKFIRSYIFDFTKRKQVEASLQESELRYQAVARQTSDGIFLAYASNKKIIDANEAYAKLLGYTNEQIVQLSLYHVIANELQEFNQDLNKVLKDKQDYLAEYLYRCKDGSFINLESSISLISYQCQDVFCFVVRNINQVKPPGHGLKSQDFERGFYDPITQLPNQKLFQEQLNIALANAQRYQYLMALIMVEIENLKQLKEVANGQDDEQLLLNLAQGFRSCLRSGDLPARWDEEQFIALLSHIRTLKDPAKIARRMSEIFQKYLDGKQEEVKLKLNIGMVIYPLDGDNPSSLLKNALMSLEQGKKSSQANYGMTGFTITPKTASVLKLENLINNAIKEQQFFLRYQPQVNIKTGRITGIEALLYWQHPESGQIEPIHYLKLAEETDLLLPLGSWVLHTACAQSKAWRDAGLPSLPIGVNLSPRQFHQSNLVAMLDKVLQQTGLPATQLELEISETCLHQNYEFAAQTIHHLVERGVHICLDNFGTGQSSLGYLEKLPFHTLKISPDSIAKLNSEPRQKAIISAIVTLAKGFNLRVVAEGVEKLTQMELLSNLECEQIQGNLFSRSLTAQEATNFFQRGDHSIIPL
jgi:diguanylate cyclase (GGDEF)-like protein/PAS domain S-box-containing protein